MRRFNWEGLSTALFIPNYLQMYPTKASTHVVGMTYSFRLPWNKKSIVRGRVGLGKKLRKGVGHKDHLWGIRLLFIRQKVTLKRKLTKNEKLMLKKQNWSLSKIGLGYWELISQSKYFSLNFLASQIPIQPNFASFLRSLHIHTKLGKDIKLS